LYLFKEFSVFSPRCYPDEISLSGLRQIITLNREKAIIFCKTRNPPSPFYFHLLSARADYGGQVVESYVETGYGGQATPSADKLAAKINQMCK
jgi:hypothetical protein